MNKGNDLIARYKYSADYVTDYSKFKDDIKNKTIIPYQVEFQPPPHSATRICWLRCPYCYGLSARDNGDRLQKERAIEIMREIATGGVKKVIFAGYATDPLNCQYIESLLEIAIDNKMIFGFNTKAIRIRPELLELLARSDIMQGSYLSVSVDAGSNETYNRVHGIKNKAKVYNRVVDNVKAIVGSRQKNGADFDISAAYLINAENSGVNEVQTFINAFQDAGCDLLRFAFPQPPRDIETAPGVVPNKIECDEFKETLSPVITQASNDNCSVMLVDADEEHQIFWKARTLPCFARFIYPTVGFDGWLYHCSQSSAPNFRQIALGDLNKQGFWETYYNYDAADVKTFLSLTSNSMDQAGCRCDRKEHIVNSGVIKSDVF